MKYLLMLFLIFFSFSAQATGDDDPPCTVPPPPIGGKPLPGFQCRLSTCADLKGYDNGEPIWTTNKSKYEVDVIDTDPNMIFYPVFLNIEDFDGLRNRDYKVLKVFADVNTHLIFEDRLLVTGFIRDLNGSMEMMIRIKDVNGKILQTHTGLPLNTSGDNEILFSFDNINGVMAIEFIEFPNVDPVIFPMGSVTLSDIKLQYGAFGNSCTFAPAKYEMKIDDNHWDMTSNISD